MGQGTEQLGQTVEAYNKKRGGSAVLRRRGGNSSSEKARPGITETRDSAEVVKSQVNFSSVNKAVDPAVGATKDVVWALTNMMVKNFGPATNAALQQSLGLTSWLPLSPVVATGVGLLVGMALPAAAETTASFIVGPNPNGQTLCKPGRVIFKCSEGSGRLSVNGSATDVHYVASALNPRRSVTKFDKNLLGCALQDDKLQSLVMQSFEQAASQDLALSEKIMQATTPEQSFAVLQEAMVDNPIWRSAFAKGLEEQGYAADPASVAELCQSLPDYCAQLLETTRAAVTKQSPQFLQPDCRTEFNHLSGGQFRFGLRTPQADDVCATFQQKATEFAEQATRKGGECYNAAKQQQLFHTLKALSPLIAILGVGVACGAYYYCAKPALRQAQERSRTGPTI